MIHLVTDGGANPHPGTAGSGAVIRQSRNFTMLWRHFPHGVNNMIELRPAVQELKHLPANMNVWVTTDSQYVRKGVLEWMPKWKRNGWKNSKKQGVSKRECGDCQTCACGV
jgi:ribonuclease HI